MMRFKFCLLAFVMLIASPAWSAYVKVSESDIGEIFLIDFETIRREGNRVKFWQIVNYPEPKAIAKQAHLSMRSRNEYDCNQEQRRLLVVNFFTGHNANGELVFDGRQVTEWRDIAPETVVWDIMKMVCNAPAR